MYKLNVKILLMVVLLLTLNCDEISGTSNDSNKNTYLSIDDAKVGTEMNDSSSIVDEKIETSTILSKVKIDTLSLHYLNKPWDNLNKIQVFENETQLVSFLDSTGYNENDTIWTEKKMTHRPDFTKWTYFTFAGANWRHTINISYEENTVTVNYIEYSYCKPIPRTSCAPPSQRVVVYFIPVTEKKIVFAPTYAEVREWISR